MNKNMVSYKIRDSWKDISKLFLFLYIVYGKALVQLGFQYGRLSSVLLIISLITCILSDRGRLQRNRAIEYEFVFILITTITSIIVARDRTISIGIAEQFFEAAIVGYIVIRLALKDKCIDVMLYAWICVALILAIVITASGGYTQLGGRISLSESMNVNTLGMIMALGIWSVLYLYPKRFFNIIGTICTVLIVALFMYVAIITASRKAIIISAAIILLWYVYCLRKYLQRVKLATKLIISVLFILAIVFIIRKFGSDFVSSSFMIQQRMQRDYLDRSSTLRFDLIVDALNVFFRNPIFGVGWNNYRLYSAYGMYSHCSYVEILACTGIIGTFLFVIWFGSIVKGYYRIINRDYQFYAIGILLLILTVDFAMQILFYNANLLYMISIVMAYIFINNDLTPSFE